MNRFGPFIMTLAAVLGLGLAPVALADTIHFEANLDGLQEVPPNASPATGSALATLDAMTGDICVEMEFSGLVAPQTAAHIHAPAPPGVNAGVILPLNNGSPSVTCGTLSMTNVQHVLDGLSYINVHSQAFPGGEIRGQLVKVPEPTTLALMALGAIALLRKRR